MENDERKMDENTFQILVVDDEEEVLKALARTLRSTLIFNAEVTTAKDGMEALNELNKQEFDLVLSDYKMPVMNGIDLLALIKKNHPKTVRILITAYGDKNSAIEAINTAEVHSYLEKPWDDSELQLNVFEVLTRKQERETASIKAVSKVKDAFKLLKKYQNNLTPIPAEHISKQLIMLEFNSTDEFNKFAFGLKSMENVHIQDIQIFEDRHIISIVVRPGEFAYIPHINNVD